MIGAGMENRVRQMQSIGTIRLLMSMGRLWEMPIRQCTYTVEGLAGKPNRVVGT